MLRDQYAVDKFFIEIAEHTTVIEPILAQIDRLLDDEELYQRLRQDLAQRHPKTTQTGRASTPVEVIMRMLAVKHLYNLSYEQTERQVRDSLVLRYFCRVYFERVPDDTTLIRWAEQVQPETLTLFNERLVHLARQLKVTRGRKLRTDGTVMESAITYPTDNKLLAAGVRVLSRTLKRAQTLLTKTTMAPKSWFRDRTRSAKRLTRAIVNATRQRQQKAKMEVQSLYRRLVQVTQANLEQAQNVIEQLQQVGGAQAEKLVTTLTTFMPRVAQVIQQTVRRVFDGQSVPAQDKIVSLFEPHSAIIRRHKAGKETEFGHKVWLDEVEGGIVTHWSILDGNPSDDTQWQPALNRHRTLFGKPPDQASGDRGLYSPKNEAYAQAQDVKRIILPKAGHKSDARRKHEAQPWFRRGRRFHNGVEGRISVLKRKHGLDRCRNQGEEGFQRWVGWGVIANNLTVMGRKLAATPRR
jgi:IS5 family transposase